MAPPNTIAWIQELVDINSGTQNRAGVLEVQKRVATALTSLGFQIEWPTNPNGESESGPLLLARRTGAASAPTVTLVSHADTVFEPSNPFQKFQLAADGKSAIGPGIIDDKASIAVGIEGCREFLKSAAASQLTLQFLCSPSEEIGSPGWHPVFHRLSEASSAVFGLEPAADNGDFVVERKGGRWYRVEVEGKPAHAGRAHHLGINAGHELAVKIDRLQKLTDYKRGSTVNLGSFEGGGGKYNVVCGHAVGRIDLRYLTNQSGKALFAKVEKILKTPLVGTGKKRAKATFKIEDNCPPLERLPVSEPWIRFYRRAIAKIEKAKSNPGFSGGGSDSSHFARPGLIVLDGVGACGGGIHTPGEFLTVDSVATRAKALSELLEFTAKQLSR